LRENLRRYGLSRGSRLANRQMQLLRLLSFATQQQWPPKYVAADRFGVPDEAMRFLGGF
jgi:hypothetical protein